MSTTPPLLASHLPTSFNGIERDYKILDKKERSRSKEKVRDREKDKKKRDRSRERRHRDSKERERDRSNRESERQRERESKDRERPRESKEREREGKDIERKHESRNRDRERRDREKERERDKDKERDRERRKRERERRDSAERGNHRDVRSHRSNSRGNEEYENRRRRRDRRERSRSRSYDKRRGDRYRRDRSRSHDRNSRDRDRRRSTSVDRERERMERERESRIMPIREEASRIDLTQSIQELMNSTTSTKNFAALFNCTNSNDSFGNAAMSENSQDANDRKRRKKSRWGGTENDKTFIPGMPTILPSTLDPSQQEAYLVQLQIEEISRKLRTGDLGIPQNLEERSPSPEPIYSSDGKRLNTREFRFRKRLEEQRHQLIQKMQSVNPEFKPPADYKPPVTRVSDKVLIPQEMHPDINFVGLLIGPRGNTLKAMEKETGAKIIIRGKGSVKEGKVGRKDGQPLPGEDEPLHAFITAPNPEAVKRAVDKIKDVIRQGIEVPEGHNDLRRMQLRELAQLNGTLRETDCQRCSNCGSMEHKSWLCPDKPNITNNIVCTVCGGAGHISKDCRINRPGGIPGDDNENNATEDTQAKIDEEYLSLMAELGEGPPPPVAVQPTKTNVDPLAQVHLQRGYSIFDKKPTQMQAIQAPPPPSPQLPMPIGPPPPIAPPPPIPPWGGSGNMPPNPQPLPPATPPLWMQPPPPGGESSLGLQPPGTGPMPPLIPPPPGTTISSAPLPPWSPPANLMPPGFGNWSPGHFMPPPPPGPPPNNLQSLAQPPPPPPPV